MIMGSTLLWDHKEVSASSRFQDMEVNHLANFDCAVDGSGNEIGFTYSYQVQDMTPGLVVTCDTNANTCVTTSPGRKKR